MQVVVIRGRSAGESDISARDLQHRKGEPVVDRIPGIVRCLNYSTGVNRSPEFVSCGIQLSPRNHVVHT